ncbi:hypothetical protein BJX70DRAFT_386036 [Aspergillus crustosus]
MRLLAPLFSILPLTALIPAAMSSNKKELVPFKYDASPLGSIKSSGWLHDQLSLSAETLPGHLFEFYCYVADSTWLGGTYEYSELNEAAPYWFNYILPLAYTIDDERLKKQAKKFLDYTLEHQAEDGWLGPETTRQTRGIWARSLFFFAIVNNFTGLLQDKDQNDNFDPFGFGVSRTHELPLALQWLYENHPRGKEEIIWETMELMFAGGRKGSRDWTEFFVEGVFPAVATPGFKTSGFTHGVNLAQGLRYPSVLYCLTRNDSLPDQTDTAVKLTEQYHYTRAGSITGDEHLGGIRPQRGSETCMAVEMMYSMAYLHRMYGVNHYADMTERPAFNALPAAISPDSLVEEPNRKPFFNVVLYGSSFGLEPNFPCCTVNHAQGYPKYVASSYVRYGRDGVVHVLLGPTTLDTRIQGNKVKISCDTKYPFNGKLSYTITSKREFDFSVRIPDLQVFKITNKKTNLNINLSMITTVSPHPNGSVAIYHGPLLYALDIEYTKTSHTPLNWTDRTPLAHTDVLPETKDYILDPISEWRYAINPDTITEELLGIASLLPVDLVVRGEPIRVRLILYRAAKLHLAEFLVTRRESA